MTEAIDATAGTIASPVPEEEVYVGGARKLGRLEPFDLKKLWSHEALAFTPWLARDENLELLSDTLGMDLELEGTEMFVGPYKADIVAQDISSNTRVIIENQLEKTNHDHLGKTLTYASGLDARVIIWIAREFTEEHRRALDFLNEVAAPNLRCFGIEMQLWRIGNSLPAPLFKVVSSPNDYSVAVKAEQEAGLTPTQALYLDFWSAFKEYWHNHKTHPNLPKPYPQHWVNIAIGRANFTLTLTVSTQKQRLGCEIYLSGPNAKKAFNLLMAQQQQIEQATGPLEWRELPGKQDCRILIVQRSVDIRDHDVWQEAFQWLRQEALLFDKAFRPRIKALPSLDNVTENAGALTESDEQDDHSI